jgi:predicted CoA-binding protein
MPSERVADFYNLESYAVIGVSRTRKNSGWMVFEELSKLGKRVYAINSQGGSRNDIKLFPGLEKLPETPQGVVICVKPHETSGVLDSLKNMTVKHIWFHLGSYNPEVLNKTGSLGFNPIKGCAIMYNPQAAGFHRFHRALNNLFGKGYK